MTDKAHFIDNNPVASLEHGSDSPLACFQEVLKRIFESPLFLCSSCRSPWLDAGPSPGNYPASIQQTLCET